MNKKERALSAILAVFPTAENFSQFADNQQNLKTLQSFIDFALSNGLIEASDEDLLEELIYSHARPKEMCMPPNHINFESFFSQKEVLLDLNLSARALTNRINALLDEHEIDLPKVSNSMLTRFKKEPADTLHKQNVLRSLAFWLGHDRAQLGPHWNFETLMAMCSESKGAADYREGVRIGFALYSRGDVIDHDTLGWLKRELKSYIDQAIGRFSYGRWGKVRSHDITTLFVDFPKENKVSNPASYRQCLQSAVSLAHQLAIRWSLSNYYSQNRLLSIGIAAGNFGNLDNYLLSILNAKLPGDPVIRLTDYARQCIQINDIRVTLSSQPAATVLFNEVTLTIWWVVGLWSYLYFDFVPNLLEDPLLQSDVASTLQLASKLWLSGFHDSIAEEGGSNAINTFFRFPHNSLLGLEISKTLYYRRRYWEALEVLRIILNLDPLHVNARTFRMVLLRNLATDAPSYSIADGLFKQVYQEAALIQTHCGVMTEDFYCEYGIALLAQAMITLRHMRNRSPSDTIDGVDMPTLKQEVFKALAQADSLFSQGQMLSPSGSRSNYMRNTIKVIQNILRNDEQLFHDASRKIDATLAIVKDPTRDYQWQLGFLREDFPQVRPFELIEYAFTFMNNKHVDAIALQAYRPTVYFCTAVAWWDLFPARTVAIAKRSIQLLQDAVTIAKEMEKLNICIYSFTRTYGEMMPIQTFIDHINKGLAMILEDVGPDLQRRQDQEVIQPKSKNQTRLLMTLNF
ncbi:MAG: hypothetical protein M0036_09685 [Desulfobacteraceae bacterium]|nr:hypothetical protein [Desulfobacteraceae bacterium]